MIHHALVHAGRSCCLYAPYLHFRVELLDGKCHSAGQSASADRDNDHLHVRQLLQQFQSYGTLSGYYILIVKGMNECVSVLVS